jgi:hypothetical protein
VRGKGQLLGDVPSFSGGRLDAFTYAEEASKRTGLPIVQTGANINVSPLTEPGVYIVPEVFDEMRPGETRCFRTYG